MSAGVVGATPASTAVRCAPSDEERRLLERHRPRLRYDRQLDYRAMAAASMLDNPGNVLRRWDGEVLAGGSAPGTPRLGTEVLERYPNGLEPEDGDHIAAAPDFAGDARRMQRDPAYADRVYGRVVRDGGRTWLQYWIWFYYNPKHLLGFGAHEGDWELVQIGLGPGDEPEVAIYASTLAPRLAPGAA